MEKKRHTRLGSDPLSWIKDSRKQQDTKSIQTREKVKELHLPKTKIGLKQGWIRATFIVREDYLEKIKAVSYWDRKDIKQVIDEALAQYLKDKKVKPKPE